MPKRKKDEARIDELLRAHGLRRTEPRVMVLRHVEKNPRPLTHGEIAQALAHTGIDRATVYRNLMDLVEAGLVTRTDLGDHVWRFESKSAHSEEPAHPHFVCTDCGTITCLPQGTVTVVAKRTAPKAIAKRRVVVQVKGVCDACA